jgi:hypothetical protein
MRLVCVKHRPFVNPAQGATSYRLAKQLAQDQADYGTAGQYHYAEQCALESGLLQSVFCKTGLHPVRQEAQMRAGRFVLWGARLVLGRLLYGYGERPIRPLFIGGLLVAACALGYLVGDGFAPGHLTGTQEITSYEVTCFWEALHFSAVTFTTLGYGDFQPKPGIWRAVADGEALAGAALLATFVVCLTRKYMR